MFKFNRNLFGFPGGISGEPNRVRLKCRGSIIRADALEARELGDSENKECNGCWFGRKRIKDTCMY